MHQCGAARRGQEACRQDQGRGVEVQALRPPQGQCVLGQGFVGCPKVRACEHDRNTIILSLARSDCGVCGLWDCGILDCGICELCDFGIAGLRDSGIVGLGGW